MKKNIFMCALGVKVTDKRRTELEALWKREVDLSGQGKSFNQDSLVCFRSNRRRGGLRTEEARRLVGSWSRRWSWPKMVAVRWRERAWFWICFGGRIVLLMNWVVVGGGGNLRMMSSFLAWETVIYLRSLEDWCRSRVGRQKSGILFCHFILR